MADSYEFKTKSRHPVLKGIGITLLVLILLAGVTAFVGWGFGWFNSDDSDVVDDFIPNDDDGIVLTSYKLDEDQFDEYGVDPLASSGYLVTATVTGGLDDRVGWRIGWATDIDGYTVPSDSVTDYVSVSYTSYYSHQCTVSCVEAFGCPIYLEAYSVPAPEVSSVVRLDYLAGVSSVSGYYDICYSFDSSDSFDFSDTYGVTSAIYSTGTVFGDLYVSSSGSYFIPDSVTDAIVSYAQDYYGNDGYFHSAFVDYNLGFSFESLVRFDFLPNGSLYDSMLVCSLVHYLFCAYGFDSLGLPSYSLNEATTSLGFACFDFLSFLYELDLYSSCYYNASLVYEFGSYSTTVTASFPLSFSGDLLPTSVSTDYDGGILFS